MAALILGLAFSWGLSGCAPGNQDRDAEPGSDASVLLTPEEHITVDIGSSATPAQDPEHADYADIEGPFLLEFGATTDGLVFQVQVDRVLVHVDGQIFALSVTDDWIDVGPGNGRWTSAWEGTLPSGWIDQLEVRLGSEVLIDGETWQVSDPWRDLFLDTPFESGEGMPTVVMTGLLETETSDGVVSPWLVQTLLRQIDDDGRAGPYGVSDGSR
jgi:hypothetical protein